MTKQHIPTIRFQGFNDEWEDEEIKNLIVKGGSGGTPKSTEKSFYNGDIPFLSITDISNSDGYILYTEKSITKLGLESSSAWIVPKGSISLAMYASVGKVGVLGNDMATSQAFYNMVFENNLLRDFIYQRLLRANGLGEWVKLVSTGTQGNLNAEKVKGFKISLPSLPEQESIGQIFRTLDDLISAYKDNLEHYQSLKTNMLSKMFPKEGQKQPEIRLDGFEGDWESSILKNLASFSKGNGYTKSDLTDNGQEIILYGQLYTDYKIQIFCSNYFVSKINNNAILSVGGEVIVPASGESADDISRASVISNPNIVIGGDLNIIYPNNNILDSVFLALMISNGSQQKELKRRAQGKSVVHLRNNDLKEVKIFLPSLPEQEAIGAFFANLDETISSYKDKIGQLELLKKNLLSQMFI